MLLPEIVCIGNLGPHDTTPYVDGLTPEHMQELYQQAEDMSRPLYWGSRPNDYWWMRTLINRYAPDARQIVDIGCGAGLWPPYIQKYTRAEVIAVDQASEVHYGKIYADFLAEHEDDGIIYTRNGIEDTTVQAMNPDVVTSVSAIEHFSQTGRDASRALMHKTLRRGALVVITTEVLDEPGGLGEWMTPDEVGADLLLNRIEIETIRKICANTPRPIREDNGLATPNMMFIGAIG